MFPGCGPLVTVSSSVCEANEKPCAPRPWPVAPTPDNLHAA